jgi:hypothetical protein
MEADAAEIPNPKLQIPKKFQVPNPKLRFWGVNRFGDRSAGWGLVLGTFLELGAWDLGFPS